MSHERMVRLLKSLTKAVANLDRRWSKSKNSLWPEVRAFFEAEISQLRIKIGDSKSKK